MQKKITVDGIDSPVLIARRRGTKSIRIALRGDGTIRLSVPYGVPEKVAIKFLQTKKDWIASRIQSPTVLHSGDRIGKSHTLYFVDDTTGSGRTSIRQGKVIVPISGNPTDHDNQTRAVKAAERALKKEAQNLLPQRLDALAKQHNVDYKSVSIKKLRSRWGSCDNHKNIVLNIYLMQLGWHLIDYVLLHELAHTYHQHHQASFWDYLETICPKAKQLRKELKQHPTSVIATSL